MVCIRGTISDVHKGPGYLLTSLLPAVDALKERVDLKSISNLVITHLTPKRMPSLKAFLQERAGQGALSIHLSNPSLQLLRSTFGASCCCHTDC